jgi:hypothetical protein
VKIEYSKEEGEEIIDVLKAELFPYLIFPKCIF